METRAVEALIRKVLAEILPADEGEEMGSIRYRKGKLQLNYVDGTGRRRRLNAKTPDMAKATELLHELEHQAQRERLGLVDPFICLAREPISTHLEAFATHLQAKNGTETHRREVLSYLREFISRMGVERLGDFDLARGEAWLVHVARRRTRLRRPTSARTVNKHRSYLLQFGNWLWRARRLSHNPMTGLPKRNQAAERVLERRALTLNEITRLLDSTPELRAIIYTLALVTGLRRSELRALRPGQLNGQLIRLSAKEVKNRKRGQAVYLPGDLAADLARLRCGSSRAKLCREARVWNPRPNYLLPTVPTKTTFYRDLRRAGIPREVDGEKVDFHALRYTFSTGLERAGCGLLTSQKLMRHSSPELTARYHHLNADERRDAIERLWDELKKAKEERRGGQ